MEIWLLLFVALLIFVVSKFIHFEHTGRKITAIAIIVLLLFLYLSFTIVAKSNSLDLTSASGIFQGAKVYFTWIGQSFSNMKTIVANAIKLDWVPEGQNVSDLNPKNYMKG